MFLFWLGVGDDYELKYMKWLKLFFVFNKDNRILKIVYWGFKIK